MGQLPGDGDTEMGMSQALPAGSVGSGEEFMMECGPSAKGQDRELWKCTEMSHSEQTGQESVTG